MLVRNSLSPSAHSSRPLARAHTTLRFVSASSVARTCNLIYIVLDVLKPLGDLKIIQAELEGFGIRLNKKPPQITVKKKERGGISLTNTVPLTHIDPDEIKAVLSEYKLNSCDIAIRQPEATLEDLIDVIEGNRYDHQPLSFHLLWPCSAGD